MNFPVANLSVYVGEDMVVVKISGRAGFTSSSDLKALIDHLSQKGHGRFVLDLKDCLLMDSTFLGVLAGLGLRFEEHPANGAGIELLGPNDRISDLLENLGVAHLFSVVEGAAPEVGPMAPVGKNKAPDPKELCRTSLEAHKTLIKIHPPNADKFRDVTEFLASELKK